MYKRYEKYKDSGVEWIGEVPENWILIRLKNAVELVARKSTKEDSGKPYIGLEHVQSWTGKLIYQDYDSNNYGDPNEESANTFKPGQVLFGKLRPYLAKGFLSSFHGRCSSELLVLEPDKIIPSYLLYMVINEGFIENVNSSTYGAKMPRASWNFIGNLNIPQPPYENQKEISNYLVHKTSEIDSLIAGKEELIKKLEEYKQSIITEAVTKGLNPDVKMKNSGIEWIGEVPEHWNHIKVKRIVSTPVTDGPHETPVLVDKGIPFVSAEAIKNNKIDFNYIRGFISEDEHLRFSKKCKPQRNDIFIVKSGATTGKIALVETDIEFSIWSPLALFRCEALKAHYNYIYYYLQSIVFQKQIQLYWHYGTQQNIGMAVLENLYVALPDLGEQKEIIMYLENILCELEDIVKEVQLHIQQLKSYRQALIYEAVTGKIDVRDYQPERSEQLA